MATRKKIKVEDNKSLERDTFSNAILNVDVNAYKSAVQRKKHMRKQIETIEELKRQIQELLQWKEEITTIISQKADK